MTFQHVGHALVNPIGLWSGESPLMPRFVAVSALLLWRLWFLYFRVRCSWCIFSFTTHSDANHPACFVCASGYHWSVSSLAARVPCAHLSERRLRFGQWLFGCLIIAFFPLACCVRNCCFFSLCACICWSTILAWLGRDLSFPVLPLFLPE